MLGESKCLRTARLRAGIALSLCESESWTLAANSLFFEVLFQVVKTCLGVLVVFRVGFGGGVWVLVICRLLINLFHSY